MSWLVLPQLAVSIPKPAPSCGCIFNGSSQNCVMQRPKWLIRPGSVDPRQMPGWTERTVRGLSLQDLLSEMAGFATNTYPYKLCEVELRRREGATARLALGIAFASLIVSIVAVAMKAG